MSGASPLPTSSPPSCTDSATPSKSGSVHGNRHVAAAAGAANPSSFSLGHGNYSRLKICRNQLRRERQADGPACVLAVGTTNPANCINQDEYTDWYFQITKSDHLTRIKDIMKRICEVTGVKKRYLQLNENLLRELPEFFDPAAPSLPAKLAAVATAMPGLAAAAAEKAIAEWGRPAGDITHLVFSTSTSAQMPPLDLRIASLLGLSPSVQRTTISFHGCAGTSTALRVAKDIAENNRIARILVICVDMLSIVGPHAPDEAHPAGIIAHALFGDGAGAVIVGAGPQGPVERAIFELVSTSQVTIPGTEHLAAFEFTAAGMGYSLWPDELAAQINRNMELCLVGALAPLGMAGLDWNDLFWVVHPGGPMIMDSITAALRLEPGKLAASRLVLSEYGNMLGPTLTFVLDEVVRRRRQQQDGEEEWGLMVGCGPGFTMEVMVLHACIS